MLSLPKYCPCTYSPFSIVCLRPASWLLTGIRLVAKLAINAPPPPPTHTPKCVWRGEGFEHIKVLGSSWPPTNLTHKCTQLGSISVTEQPRSQSLQVPKLLLILRKEQTAKINIKPQSNFCMNIIHCTHTHKWGKGEIEVELMVTTLPKQTPCVVTANV